MGPAGNRENCHYEADCSGRKDWAGGIYADPHHTRQSAVGLPVLEKRVFGGREYTVTEYTMSELLASVYQCMEKQKVSRGILFLDEINCVSETLAPAMLQFLQQKTFGTHHLPEGWVIVAAGNPEKYNKSVPGI